MELSKKPENRNNYMWASLGTEVRGDFDVSTS